MIRYTISEKYITRCYSEKVRSNGERNVVHAIGFPETMFKRIRYQLLAKYGTSQLGEEYPIQKPSKEGNRYLL